jgi:hypothetical protein
MKKWKQGIFGLIAIIALVFGFTACSKHYDKTLPAQENVSSSEVENIETLDEAMQWYLQNIQSHFYMESDHFVFSYRILDTIEESGMINIYAHTLCKWITLSGEDISGGAGLSKITFQKVDDVYHYMSHKYYVKPDEDDIPKKVKDIYSDGSYFDIMREEVDKSIVDFLDSN